MFLTTVLQGAELNWGLSFMQGKRPTMEDEHVHIVDSKEECGFFGVYDGHGGVEAAKYAKKHLHEIFSNAKGSIQERMYEAFLKTDEKLLQCSDIIAGTTAVVAFIEKDWLHIGWAGDSRAVFARDGKIIFASQDHKPDDPEEKKRIERAGGFVKKWGVWRVYPGGLAVARALGDKDLKQQLPGGIIAKPSVVSIPLKTTQNSFLILACDGLWDVVTNVEAVKVVDEILYNENRKKSFPFAIKLLKQLFRSTKDIEKFMAFCNAPYISNAAQELRDLAYSRGSTDNISVLVVRLD